MYDPDTNMCFLAGKGDRNVQFIELTDKDPFIIEGLKYSGEQTKGNIIYDYAKDCAKRDITHSI